MKSYKYIFIVLVYKNTDDICSLLESIKKNVNNYKIIIVNGYYDDATKNDFMEIANKYNCDFLNIPNKGYGYGNNKGINYIQRKYEYEFIIVSNPDIEIEKFNDVNFYKHSKNVIGPMIKTQSGKKQNPYWSNKFDFTEYLIYLGYKKDIKLFRYIGIVINKIIRELSLLSFGISRKQDKIVFALHGSFIIFSKYIVEKFMPLYDEKMFLFGEEAYLAHRFCQAKISSYITKDIQVLHKEDGSISISNINTNKEASKSVIYYYEKLKGKDFKDGN